MKINSSTQIIAEIGNTHEGSLALAKRFVKVASECRVNSVKFQTHIFAAESLHDAPNPPYFADESRKDYFNRTSFKAEEWKKLKNYAERECGLEFISSPFSIEAVNLLEKIGLKTYKIPSGEVTNLPLLKKIAKTQKRVILSSGMSSWAELDNAVNALKKNGCKNLTVLQCTTKYPCPPDESGLNIMIKMKERYNLPVGLSDHTQTIGVAVAAVALGASIVEKHFTLSRQMYGSDAKNSSEPEEFALLVREIRSAEKALQKRINKDKKAKDLADMKKIFEKSIVAKSDISKGIKLKEKHFSYKKPGDGISASLFNRIIGRTLKKSVKKNHKFSFKDFK